MIREYASVKPYPVRFRDCDPEGRIHWHQLMDYAQDCDDSNCALIEARSDQLHERDACWILLAQSIQLTRDRPVFEDSFFVESWSCGVKGIRFYRENRYYRNRLDEAHLFGRGISEWIICSLDDHRPLRPASVLDMDLFSQKSDPSPDPVRKLPRLTPFGGEEAGLKGHEYTVGYSDLDINNHLHNTHYLRLAIRGGSAWPSIISISNLSVKVPMRRPWKSWPGRTPKGPAASRFRDGLPRRVSPPSWPPLAWTQAPSGFERRLVCGCLSLRP